MAAPASPQYNIQPQQKGQVSPKVAEVKRLYGKYNPEKLGDVPTLLAKYGEDKLLAMVRKKYEAQEMPASERGPPPTAPQAPPLAEVYGADAARAMQQEIAQHGTANIQKIARLRRASVQQVPQSPRTSPQYNIQPQQKEQVSPKVAEVKRLYGKYNPEKLPDVPTLLAKYGEDKLCAMVRKKYEAQEGPPAPAADPEGSFTGLARLGPVF
jgi:hypothetical protein